MNISIHYLHSQKQTIYKLFILFLSDIFFNNTQSIDFNYQTLQQKNMQQSEAKTQRKRKQEVIKLISKIRRLKNKLVSYGMSGKQSIDAILYEFLKAPHIDWTLPHNTAIFYQIQNKYHTDHNTAQLILILNAIVPNWETRNVVQYLHQTLTYNALSFGIDLQISDDSSNEDGNDMTLMLIKAKKKNKQFGLKPKKRSHHFTNPSSNVHFYNSFKEYQYNEYDQQLKKKIHSNQKIEDIKAERKQTEGNIDEGDLRFQNQNYVPNFLNENCMLNINHQNQHQENKSKRSTNQNQQEKCKRLNPYNGEFLDEQKLQKKRKR